jgi:hypothetical protein
MVWVSSPLPRSFLFYTIIDWAEDEYRHNTARQRRYAADNLVAFLQQADDWSTTCNPEDEYAVADAIRAFYRDDGITKPKVVAIRDFLQFIGRRLSTRDQDRLERVRELVKYSRVADRSQHSSSELDINEEREKLIRPQEFEQLFQTCDLKTELVVRVLFDTGIRAGSRRHHAGRHHLRVRRPRLHRRHHDLEELRRRRRHRRRPETRRQLPPRLPPPHDRRPPRRLPDRRPDRIPVPVRRVPDRVQPLQGRVHRGQRPR